MSVSQATHCIHRMATGLGVLALEARREHCDHVGQNIALLDCSTEEREGRREP